ncbi:MAG: DMT family transporter [Bdellovibrionales bacterium]|nr:DMT family transporter [Bdellovibrionales bacterium]
MFNSNFMALASTFSFALGAHAFFTFGRRIHYVWLGLFKSLIALIIFLVLLVFKGNFNLGDQVSFLQFFFSGFLGLGLADLFILKAFLILRPGRTLIITGFQPLFVGIFSFIFMGHSFAWEKLYGILCFILCTVILSQEKSHSINKDTYKGIAYSFIGVILNSFSCILTRLACDQSPAMDSIEGNTIRIFGALVCFILFFRFLETPRLTGPLRLLKSKDKLYLLIGTLFAAVISLIFYMIAIKHGDPTTITAIGITLPLFSYALEIISDKKRPSRAMVLSFFSFVVGAFLIL